MPRLDARVVRDAAAARCMDPRRPPTPRTDLIRPNRFRSMRTCVVVVPIPRIDVLPVPMVEIFVRVM